MPVPPTARRRSLVAPDRGATLVEYSLVLALLVAAAIVSIEFLTERSDAEVNNQADCVSMRPPPVDCQVAAVPPNFVPGGPGFVPPTTAPPAPDPPPTGTVELAEVGPVPTPAGDAWWVRVPVLVTEIVIEPPLPDPQAVVGAPVTARVRLVDPANPAVFLPISEFVSCTTGIDGRCTLEYTVPFVDVVRLRVDQFVVNTVPQAVIAPAGAAVDALRPPLP